MPIVRGNNVSLHDQIVRDFSRQLQEGQYKTGDYLPSVRRISEEKGVSINVIQRAIKKMESEGLVVCQQGKGVQVASSDLPDKIAKIFGMIIPFTEDENFGVFVGGNLFDIFGENYNFIVVRSSKNDSLYERDLIEHMLVNNVRGIMLWPVSNDSNASYLREISQKTPIVLVDRCIKGLDLPAVVHDYRRAGEEMASEIFKQRKCHRLLVLVDEIHSGVSGFVELVDGIRQQAIANHCGDKMTIVNVPMIKFLNECKINDKKWPQSDGKYLKRIIADGGYDAIFIPHNEYFYRVVVEGGLTDELPGIVWVTLRNNRDDYVSQKYHDLGDNFISWRVNLREMVSRAAEMLQSDFKHKKANIGLVKIQLESPVGKD